MNCPYCNTDETSVIDSREAEERTCIRRRRTCVRCDKRFTTYERVEGIELKVLKKDGIKEDFSREKLRRGIVKATWKRPVSMADIDELIDEIERLLRQRKTSEVKSWEIGNLVINRLKRIDTLSYLLFASVYRDFASLDDFAEEVRRLQENAVENTIVVVQKKGAMECVGQ
jgi:transcriptional repressor NrdR